MTKGYDQASLQYFLQYRFGTAQGLGLVEKYCLPWRRTSESANVLPSCECYAAIQNDMIMIMSGSPL
jgi:hypothetical protein